MGDHVVLSNDRLITPESVKILQSSEAPGPSGSSSCSHKDDPSALAIDIMDDEVGGAGEEEPLLQTVECRICQDEDIANNLEVPCACSGSLKFAHRKCVQRWCDEKGDIICEICHQPYQPGYTAPPRPSEDTSIDIGSAWTIAGNQLNLHDPRLLAMVAAERHLLEADYDDYSDSSASGAAFCRSVTFLLMALLLLKHALSIGNGDGDDDDVSAIFSLFLLRAAAFLIPCYIMAWFISILQRRRQRQEAAALAAAEVAFMLQAGQHRGLHVAIAPRPAPAPGASVTTAEVPTVHAEQV
nr:E3 ubiquitin ligase SUD1 [Ipomoea batatas]GMC56333.1 E3 ubiquitin ligase SUD1 [Ipomoea batatas]